MTILHVLKYNPKECVDEYLSTNAVWEDIFPQPLAEVIRKQMTRTIYAGFVSYEQCRCVVAEALLEYEGPLE